MYYKYKLKSKPADNFPVRHHTAISIAMLSCWHLLLQEFDNSVLHCVTGFYIIFRALCSVLHCLASPSPLLNMNVRTLPRPVDSYQSDLHSSAVSLSPPSQVRERRQSILGRLLRDAPEQVLQRPPLALSRVPRAAAPKAKLRLARRGRHWHLPFC